MHHIAVIERTFSDTNYGRRDFNTSSASIFQLIFRPLVEGARARWPLAPGLSPG